MEVVRLGDPIHSAGVDPDQNLGHQTSCAEPVPPLGRWASHAMTR